MEKFSDKEQKNNYEEMKNETTNEIIAQSKEHEKKIESLVKEAVQTVEEDKTVEELFKEIKDEVEKEDNRNKKEKKVEVKDNYQFQPRTNKSKKMIIIGLGTVFLVILAILSTGFALANINNPGIIVSLTVRNIEMRDMTRENATSKLSEILNENLETDIIIRAGTFETTFNPADIEARYNIEEIVEEAHNIGRNGNIFRNNFEIMSSSIRGRDIEPKLMFDEELLKEIVEEMMFRLPGMVLEPTYSIQGNELIITRGVAGNTIDAAQTKNLILERNKKWRRDDFFRANRSRAKRYKYRRNICINI